MCKENEHCKIDLGELSTLLRPDIGNFLNIGVFFTNYWDCFIFCFCFLIFMLLVCFLFGFHFFFVICFYFCAALFCLLCIFLFNFFCQFCRFNWILFFSLDPTGSLEIRTESEIIENCNTGKNACLIVCMKVFCS